MQLHRILVSGSMEIGTDISLPPQRLGERLVLVGGMHVRADSILGEADLGAVMLGIENATDLRKVRA